jgi:hypothetical protein
MRAVINKRIIIGLLFFCSLSIADYLNPPDWADSNDFTHQTWDFLTDEAEYLPAPPDGEPNSVNPFGTPGLIDIEYTTDFQFWMWNPYPQYLDVPPDNNGFYGGMGDTTLTFRIPNIQRGPFWQKQLWIQVVYWARNDGGQTYDLEIARDSNFVDTNNITVAYLDPNVSNEPNGDIGRFYRLTTAYRFEEQPGEEYVRFTAFQYPPEMEHPYGGASMIDQVSIDTRCVNLDQTEDGIINLQDYAVMANDYYSNNSSCDLNPDGFIDFEDLSVLLEHWLEVNH